MSLTESWWPFIAAESRQCTEALYEKLRREISESDAAKIVISSEAFGNMALLGTFGETHTAMLREMLSGVDIRVVFYMRRQDEWLLSQYNQLVRAPASLEARSFGDFINEAKAA
jgi:hypothetical protein